MRGLKSIVNNAFGLHGPAWIDGPMKKTVSTKRSTKHGWNYADIAGLTKFGESKRIEAGAAVLLDGCKTGGRVNGGKI